MFNFSFSVCDVDGTFIVNHSSKELSYSIVRVYFTWSYTASRIFTYRKLGWKFMRQLSLSSDIISQHTVHQC